MMTTPFHNTLKKVNSKLDLSSILKNNKSDWVAWRYAGILKNHRANSVPLITVIFRELIDGKLLDEEIQNLVPISLIGQVRLGSIWNGGRCKTEAVFECYEGIIVDFTQGSWRFNSFYESINLNQPEPYPNNLHPCAFNKDKSWFLEFPIPNGGKLVIPCMEFLASCYGHSEELNRILTTYPWGQGKNSVIERLTSPLNVPENGRWLVNLQPLISNADAVIVAHLKYDQYAQSVAKEIYAQLEATFAKASKAAYIKVHPWFEGLAELNVEGYWFDNNKSFLALRVNGISDPNGVPIERYRQYRVKNEKTLGQDGNNNFSTKIPERKIVSPEIVNMTKDKEPDRNSSMVFIFNEGRKKLGTPRVVFSGNLAKDGYKIDVTLIPSNSSNETEFSTGQEHGSGKGVGKALIRSKPVLESEGVLWDMWKAMLYLKLKYPENVTSVDWFNFEDDFNNGAEPRYIEFEAPNNDDLKEANPKNPKWVYLESNILRGLLALRLCVDGKFVYIFEIQRRQTIKIKDDGTHELNEENFKGFVFTLADDNDFKSTLREFMRLMVFVSGVTHHFISNVNGQAYTFNHVTSNKDVVLYENSLLNALGKVNIKLRNNPE